MDSENTVRTLDLGIIETEHLQYYGSLDPIRRTPNGGGGVIKYGLDGDRFIGTVNDKFEKYGRGVYVTKGESEKYIGEWSDDKQNGKGLMYYGNGDKYEGGWKDGKPHGKGRLVFENGDLFIGNWICGYREGEGKLIYSVKSSKRRRRDDGVKPTSIFYDSDDEEDTSREMYHGNYKKNERSGFGIYKYRNGNKYVGAWKHSKMHGLGTFYWVNGDKYCGWFSKDQKHGKGEHIMQSDNWNEDDDKKKIVHLYYYGEWVNGDPIGDYTVLNEIGMMLLKLSLQKKFKNFADSGVTTIEQLLLMVSSVDDLKKFHIPKKERKRIFKELTRIKRSKEGENSMSKEFEEKMNELRKDKNREIDLLKEKIKRLEKKEGQTRKEEKPTDTSDKPALSNRQSVIDPVEKKVISVKIEKKKL